MSTFEQFFSGGGSTNIVPTTIISNKDSSGNHALTASLHVAYGEYIENAGSLSSDTYETVLNLTSKEGYIDFLCWASTDADAAAKVVTMRVTVDGTEVGAYASPSISTPNQGCILVGNKGVGTGMISAGERVYFSDSFKVEIKSSTTLAASGEIFIRYKGMYKTA